MTSMVRLSVAFMSLTIADSLTCLNSSNAEPDCSKTGCAVCYYSSGGDYGCVPADSCGMADFSEPGCNDQVCWCKTNDCNNHSWYTEFKQAYVPPPMCYTGIAGSNEGPSCKKSQLYKDSEYKKPDCHIRGANNKCIENNKGMGMGDGCDSHNDQSACDGDSRTRDTEDSYDGTSKYCRWLPAQTKDQTKDNCEVDDGCTYFPDRGHCRTENGSPVCEGHCESSDSANSKESSWNAERGKDCEKRIKHGCLENNDGLGEASRCTDHKDENSCISYAGSDCSEGICSGSSTDGTPCAQKNSEGWCTGGQTGCTWKKQCCQWLAKPVNMMDTCLTSGAGTVGGMCQFHDGNGPPSADIVTMGYSYGLLSKRDKYANKCAMVASFRTGFGSAVTLGSNKKDLVGANCLLNTQWKSYAENIGHTSDSIDEYCSNFIPDNSTMSTLSQHSPGYIIQKVKEGQFGALFPGLKHLLYLVTAKPEYGECFFTAEQGTWGAGVCTCEGAECNNQTALGFIVDLDKGPMRLLQFIDGSLSELKDEINGAVSGLLDAEGKINSANVPQVTESDITSIMLVPGVSNKTNKDELWGIVQDYQALLSAESAYKQSLMAHYAFKSLQITANKVQQANAAAGCELYGDDGVPNTVCLQSLSANSIVAVSTAVGVAAADLTTAKAAAEKLETGTALAHITTAITTTAPPAAADVTITGTMTLQVPDADAFISDTNATNAVRDGIAAYVGVSPSHVVLVITKGSRRRLHGVQKARKLSGSNLLVSYTITVPASAGANVQADAQQKLTAAASSTTALRDAITTQITEAKGNDASNFAVTVTSMTTPTAVLETTTRPVQGSADNAVVSMLGSVALTLAFLASS